MRAVRRAFGPGLAERARSDRARRSRRARGCDASTDRSNASRAREQSAEYAEALERALRALRRAHPTLAPGFDVRALSRAIQGLLVAEERFLGASARASGRTPACAKIPHWTWRDGARSGALLAALDVYVRMRRDGTLRSDLTGEDAREGFEQFARAVRDELVERRFTRYVKIYVADDAADARELKKLAREMRATLAMSPRDEGVTHVLRNDNSFDDEVDDASMWRITETSTSVASGGKPEHRVHFWFYPDSYDQWYADSSLSGRGKSPWAPQTSAFLKSGWDPKEPYTVRARWLRDSHKFNEWMNELDYEFDLGREVVLGSRYPWDARDFPSKKRADPEMDFDGEIFAQDGADRLTHFVTRRRVVRAHPCVAAAASQDDGALVLLGDQEDITKEFMSAKSIKFVNITAGQLPPNATPSIERKSHEDAAPLAELRVPTHSAWFRWTEAHEIERRALPEFFGEGAESNGRDEYIECRNAMIRTFVQKGRNVTLDEVKPKLSASTDAGAAARIFSFLEDWGLVNWIFATERDVYRLKDDAPAGCPRIVRASGDSLRVEAPDVLDAIKAKIFDFAKVRATTPSGKHPLIPATEVAGAEAQLERRSLDELFASLHALRELEVRFDCNMCGADLNGGVFYHSTIAEGFDLCEACFPTGCYPEGHTGADFVKAVYPDFDAIDAADANGDDSEWSPQEMAALLEAVAQSAGTISWSDVAASVGSKGEDECAKCFARLPVNDGAIAELGRRLRSPSGVVMDDSGASLPDADSAPFALAPNPLMSQLEFLMNTISPRVAAAAAKAALTEYASRADSVKDATFARRVNAKALAAAATQAKLLAQDEEHEIRRIMSGILDVLLKKLELKLRFLEFLDASAKRAVESFSTQAKNARTERKQNAIEAIEYDRRADAAAPALERVRQRLAAIPQ